MYQVRQRVRFSEMEPDGRMSLPAIMDSMQDCSDFQSEDLGIGYRFLAERNRGWVVAFWQLIIDRRPADREEIVVETRPWKFELFYGFRNFAVYDSAGAAIVKANSLWCFLDTEHMRPTRPKEEEIGPYGVDERLDMEYTKLRKIKLPAGIRKLSPVKVQRSHLDLNNHVNNVQYIAIALSLFDREPEIREIRVEYRKAARLGDTLYPALAADEEWQYVSLEDEEGAAYCVIQFREENPDQ